MKTIVFTSLFLLFAFVLNAQLTLDKKYDFSTSVVQLETLGYKYFLMDVPNGQCRIYSMDHSLFKTINCNVPPDFYLSDIKFISENIFDKDPGIELLCTFYKYNSSLNYYEYDSKIINEDGSLILFIDGALYNYIKYAGENSLKLFSYSYDYSVFPENVWTNVYDLPKNPVYGEEEITICSGSNYLGWTESGTYVRTIVLANGGDSIVTTQLIVLSAIESYEEITICEGENYLDWTTPGIYSRILKSVFGCDSLIYTELNVLNPVYYEEEISICAGEKYKDWYESGNYTETFTSIAGCDSIVTAYLTVNSPLETIQNITICVGDNYNGLDSEGRYSELYNSFLGCDSIVITNLSFYPSQKPEIIVWGDTLKSETGFGKYQWFYNESEITGANLSEYVITESGEYSLKITDSNGCFAISAPVNVVFSTAGNGELNKFKYAVVPNPNNGQFSFQLDSNPFEKIQLVLYNSLGQAIETRVINKAPLNFKTQFDVTRLGKGIYYLQMELDGTIKTEKVILR